MMYGKKHPMRPGMGMGKPDPEAPEPLEAPAKKPMPAMPPEEEEGGFQLTSKEYGEEGEESMEEPGDGYSGELMADIDRVGEQHGMDSESSRAFAGDLMRAMAACMAKKA